MSAPVQVGPSPQGGGPAPSTPAAGYLTARHLQILQLAANGYSNKRIGTQLGTKENTIKSQMAVILKRLRVNDRTQAVAVGIRIGLVSLDTVTIPQALTAVREEA
jgi:DNA-binding NarL/FixJ family response regulator